VKHEMKTPRVTDRGFTSSPTDRNALNAVSRTVALKGPMRMFHDICVKGLVRTFQIFGLFKSH